MSRRNQPNRFNAKEIIRRTVLPTLPVYAILVLGLLALAHPNSIWTSAVLSTAALLPLLMIVAGRYGSENRRPWRYGFAACCGGYFLFFTVFLDSPYLVNLATSKALDAYYHRLYPGSTFSQLPNLRGGFGGAFDIDDDAAADAPAAPSSAMSNLTQFQKMTDQLRQAMNQQMTETEIARNFWLIGHATWALLFGWVGGRLASFLARRQANEEALKRPSAAGR